MFKFPSSIEKVGVKIPFIFVFYVLFKSMRKLLARNIVSNIFFRRLEVSLYPFGTLNNSENSPEIDILILVAPKDIELLNNVIHGGIYSSFNHIRKIHVVTPNRADLNRSLNSSIHDKIFIYEDGDILDTLLLQFIDMKCGKRSGWVKQQLIANFFASHRADIPILNIDSDTILTKQRKWIDSSFTQIFTPTWEFNSGYYEFLARLNPDLYRDIDLSFVPHHMLFIPEKLRFINKLNNLDFDNLFSIIDQQLIEGNVNFFDFKYDYYAQAFINLKLNYSLEKWSNLSLCRNSLIDLTKNIVSQEDFNLFAGTINYASVSGHDWKRVSD
jgi:hypothetical protein